MGDYVRDCVLEPRRPTGGGLWEVGLGGQGRGRGQEPEELKGLAGLQEEAGMAEAGMAEAVS